jgi:hypothetical protein
VPITGRATNDRFLSNAGAVARTGNYPLRNAKKRRK